MANRQLVNVSPSVQRAQRQLSLAEALQAQNMQAKPSSLAETMLRLGGAYFQNRAIDKAAADLDQAAQAQEEAKAKRLSDAISMIMGNGGGGMGAPPAPMGGPDPLYSMQPPTSAPMTPSPVPDLGGGAVGASGLPSLAPPSQTAATTPPAGFPPAPAGGAYPQEFAANPSQPMRPNPMAQAMMLQLAAPELAGVAAPFLAEQMRSQNDMAMKQAEWNRPDWQVSGGVAFNRNAPTPQFQPIPQPPPADPWRATDGGLVNQATGEFKPLPAGQGAGGPFKGNAIEAQDRNILLSGDPSSPEYAAAYASQSAPKITGYDQQTGQAIISKPDMSWARPPASAGQKIAGDMQPPQSGPKIETMQIGGGRVPTDVRTKGTELTLDLQKMQQALSALDEMEKLNPQARGGMMAPYRQMYESATGNTTPEGALTAQFQNLAKSDAFAQLNALKGVASDSDLRFIAQELTAGIDKPPEFRAAILQNMRKRLQRGIMDHQQMLQAMQDNPQGVPNIGGQPQQPAAQVPQGGVIRYDAQGNRIP